MTKPLETHTARELQKMILFEEGQEFKDSFNNTIKITGFTHNFIKYDYIIGVKVFMSKKSKPKIVRGVQIIKTHHGDNIGANGELIKDIDEYFKKGDIK